MDAITPPGADLRSPLELRSCAGHASKMRESADISQIAPALACAQAAMTNPPRNRNVEVRTRAGATYTFRYATLDTITEMIRPALASNGLCVLQPIVSTERGMALVTRLLHASGQWMECEVRMPPLGDDPQALGSLITYLRRYSVSALLNICPDEDDDANHAAGNHVRDAAPRKSNGRASGQDARQANGTLPALPDHHGDPMQALISRASTAEGTGDGQDLLETWQRHAAGLERHRGSDAWDAMAQALGAGLQRSLGAKAAAAFIAALRAADAQQAATVQGHWDGKWAETLAAMQRKAPAIHTLLQQHVAAQAERVRGLAGQDAALPATDEHNPPNHTTG